MTDTNVGYEPLPAEPEPVIADTSEIEQQVLTSVLYLRSVPTTLLEQVQPKHFFRIAHGEIWRIMCELSSAGAELDLLPVMDALRESAPRAVETMHRLVVGDPTLMRGSGNSLHLSTNAEYYAERIVNGYHARKLQERLLRAQQMLAYGRLDDALLLMSEPGEDVEIERYGYTLAEVHDQLIAEAAQPERIVPTPWRSVNALLYGGLTPGRLYIACGSPGTGKTITAQCVATHAARKAVGSLVFSLEMQRTELLRRIYSTAEGVPMAEVMRHDFQLSAESYEKVQRFLALSEQDKGDGQKPSNLIINDDEGLTVEEVRSKARIAARRWTIGAIVVDYLQLVDAPHARSEVEQVKHVARQLKLMAKELQLPVLALAQPNRNAAYRDGGKIQMSDLHGSSEIEKAADVIILLNKVTGDDEDGDIPAELISFDIVKNRQGKQDSIRMLFDGARQNFEEL